MYNNLKIYLSASESGWTRSWLPHMAAGGDLHKYSVLFIQTRPLLGIQKFKLKKLSMLSNPILSTDFYH